MSYAWKKDPEKGLVKLRELLTTHAELLCRELSLICYQEVENNYSWGRAIRLPGTNFAFHSWKTAGLGEITLQIIYKSPSEWKNPKSSYTVLARIFRLNYYTVNAIKPGQGVLATLDHHYVDIDLKQKIFIKDLAFRFQAVVIEAIEAQGWTNHGPYLRSDSVLMRAPESACMQCPFLIPCKISSL